MAKILLFILATLLNEIFSVVGTDVGKGACTCGVFSENSSNVIIERPLEFNVSCDEDGAKTCQQLCAALAQAAKDKAPAMICEKLKTRVENLKVAVYAKSCEIGNEWKFTGLKNLEPICCHETKEVECTHVE